MRVLKEWCDDKYMGFVSAELCEEDGEYWISRTNQNGGEVGSPEEIDIEELVNYLNEEEMKKLTGESQKGSI